MQDYAFWITFLICAQILQHFTFSRRIRKLEDRLAARESFKSYIVGDPSADLAARAVCAGADMARKRRIP